MIHCGCSATRRDYCATWEMESSQEAGPIGENVGRRHVDLYLLWGSAAAQAKEDIPEWNISISQNETINFLTGNLLTLPDSLLLLQSWNSHINMTAGAGGLRKTINIMSLTITITKVSNTLHEMYTTYSNFSVPFCQNISLWKTNVSTLIQGVNMTQILTHISWEPQGFLINMTDKVGSNKSCLHKKLLW